MVPNGWREYRLGDLAEKVGSGLTPRGGESVYVLEGIPFIRSQNVLRGRLDLADVVYITEEQHAAMASTQLKPLDVLLNISGASIGRSCVVPDDFSEGNVNQHVCIIRCNHQLNPVFLSSFLNSWYGQRLIWQSQAGGNREGLNYDQIRKFHLVIPPLPEQERIAAILSTWDTAIEQTTKLIEGKRKLKKGLMQQLLTGKLRFPRVTERWRECKLGEVFCERKETNRTNLPLLSVTGERGVIPHEETGRKDSSAEDKSKYKRIVCGDIGYNTMRMWQGVSALSRLEGIVSPAYTICSPKKRIHGSFAAHLFKFPPIVHLFYRYSQGLVSDTLNLKFPNFAHITATLPPLDEQKKIAAVLDTVDEEVENLCRVSDQLKGQKSGLMQKLLTGQVRVKAIKEITE